MNIDCKAETITCKCGNTEQIKFAELFRCTDCNHIHFECSICKSIQNVPLELNDFFNDLFTKYDREAEREFDNSSNNDIADIFLGQNQVPLTDELITRLVKEKGMDKEDLLYMQKEGAQYSITRDSFIFPPEGDFDKFL